MEEWDVSTGDGGWLFSTAAGTRCQVTLHRRGDAWSVVCTRYPSGRRQRAKYGARSNGESALQACLLWVEQYLANVGEPPFDALQARTYMLEE